MIQRVTERPASYWVAQQKDWIARCGGDLEGYIANYGSVHDEQHSGDGGEAIYAADIAYLRQLEARHADERDLRRVNDSRAGRAQSERRLRAETALTHLAHAIGCIERIRDMYPLALSEDARSLSMAIEDLDDVRNFVSSTLQ
jgi:hypothetical protein